MLKEMKVFGLVEIFMGLAIVLLILAIALPRLIQLAGYGETQMVTVYSQDTGDIIRTYMVEKRIARTRSGIRFNIDGDEIVVSGHYMISKGR